MGASPFVPLTMFGWFPLGLWLFKRFQGRVAIIVGFLIAWLFLPVYTYSLPGIPDYSKGSAMGYVVLLGVFIFDRERLQKFKLTALDCPILVFCFSNFCSSVSNGLGAYDGVSASLGALTGWYLPYFLGRLYFRDLESFRDLIIGVLVGGIIYVPFCMFEMVMSPRLHRIVYGFHPHSFGQSRRWGGWRPVVFMQHGLMVGMWMVTATLAGLQLLKLDQLAWVKKYFKVKPALFMVGMILVTILCKSTGAILLMIIGAAVLHFSMKCRTRVLLVVLMLVPTFYVVIRTTGTVNAASLTQFLSEQMHLEGERVGSLTFRFANEDILMNKTFDRPIFGWGGWKRSFVLNEDGEPISVPDGMWIVIFGKNGWLGLVSMLTTLFLPQWLYLRRFPPKTWAMHPYISLGLAPVVLIALFMIDGLLNDMFNPLIMILSGGMTSLYLNQDMLDPVMVGEASAESSKNEADLYPKRTRLL